MALGKVSPSVPNRRRKFRERPGPQPQFREALPTFLEGGRGPGTQAKLMPKLSLMPTHATCQGLGQVPGHGLWVGTGSAGLT